jgi:hypothetical protein
MCEKNNCHSNSLSPRICLRGNPNNPHKICEGCWFNSKNGFVMENRDHTCPGCNKGMPLPPLPTQKTGPDLVIDMTGDSDGD